jgi:NADPH:quinone reductase-like Zn-dependent oxidoreductase
LHVRPAQPGVFAATALGYHETMTTIELRHFGIDGLSATHRPPPAPGAGQILLQMRAAALNFRDLAIVRGEYGGFALPLVPVSDGVGRVVRIGAGVTRFAPGDRVVPSSVPDWIAGPADERSLRRRLGGPLPGLLSEQVVVDETAAILAPPHLCDEEAATLPIAGGSAWQALFGAGKVLPGDVVVVQGTGGVSLFAVQLAALAGARIIVTSKSDAKLARARQLGAHDTINYRETPDWQVEVRRLTDGRGADLVLDLAGGDQLNRSIAATRVGGAVSVLGFVAGGTATIDLTAAIRGAVTLQTASGVSRASLEALARALTLHDCHPVIDRVFPIAEVQAAFAHLAAGNHFGKVVLRWD